MTMKQMLVKAAAWISVITCALNAPPSLWVVGLVAVMWLIGVMYGIERTVDRAADDLRKIIGKT